MIIDTRQKPCKITQKYDRSKSKQRLPIRIPVTISSMPALLKPHQTLQYGLDTVTITPPITGPILSKYDLFGMVFISLCFEEFLIKVAAINMSTAPPIIEMQICATSKI
ncbi:MAG: hypothetical protein CM1200mP8_5320 [Chloroflexota bacterium]|nr:MAG: hypothetical protein CM1200mP8_5320 [Chloroflexota bacterium]